MKYQKRHTDNGKASEESNKEKSGRKTLREKLEQNLDIPSDLLCGGCFVELRGRGNAAIGGCRRILVYSPDTVRLGMKDFDLVLRGKRLVCTSYCDGAVVIDGIISSLEYKAKGDGEDNGIS